jgi:hypothetical protein
MKVGSVNDVVWPMEVLSKLRDKLCITDLFAIKPAAKCHAFWFHNCGFEEGLKAPGIQKAR